jgi:hypothetical protein
MELVAAVHHTRRVWRDPLFLLRGRTKSLNRIYVQRVVRTHNDPDTGAPAGYFFHGNGVGEGVQLRAIVLGRHV